MSLNSHDRMTDGPRDADRPENSILNIDLFGEI